MMSAAAHTSAILGADLGKFIIVTFLMLGWGFWVMSGGSDFVPESSADQTALVVEPSTDAGNETPQVTRSNTENLTSVTAEVTPVSLEATPEVAPVVEEAITLAEPEPAPAPEVAPLDLRAVAGTRVNLREGPGTDYGVLVTLDGGTEAEVIEVNEDGWARIRIVGTSQLGWIAESLLERI